MRRQRISVVVLGEGITEKYYLESLRVLLPIKPVPKITKHTTVPYIEKMINQLIEDLRPGDTSHPPIPIRPEEHGGLETSAPGKAGKKWRA